VIFRARAVEVAGINSQTAGGIDRRREVTGRPAGAVRGRRPAGAADAQVGCAPGLERFRSGRSRTLEMALVVGKQTPTVPMRMSFVSGPGARQDFKDRDSRARHGVMRGQASRGVCCSRVIGTARRRLSVSPIAMRGDGPAMMGDWIEGP